MELHLRSLLEGEREGRVTWERLLSSFILAKLALDLQPIKDFGISNGADGVKVR